MPKNWKPKKNPDLVEIDRLIRQAEKEGYLEQAIEKAGLRWVAEPETNAEWLGWLIDEWEVQSVLAHESFKREGPTADEGHHRVGEAANLAGLVGKLMDAGLTPKWPHPYK